MMTRVFDQLEMRATGERRENEFSRRPAVVHAIAGKTGEIRPYQLDANEEYELNVTVAARFWANTAQVFEARKHAERTLMRLLYADVLADLDGIAHCVSDGEQIAAMTRIAELRAKLTA